MQYLVDRKEYLLVANCYFHTAHHREMSDRHSNLGYLCPHCDCNAHEDTQAQLVRRASDMIAVRSNTTCTDVD